VLRRGVVTLVEPFSAARGFSVAFLAAQGQDVAPSEPIHARARDPPME
jgi:hypothetical protein